MKQINRIFQYTLFLMGFLLVACQDDDENVARAVLGTSTVLEFEAVDAQPQTITVYSDAQWKVVTPSWITVDPKSGTGTTKVTISVTDNVVDGEMDVPRQDTLVFRGKTKASCFYVIVSQKGDTYKYAEHVDVAGLAALEDGTPLVLEPSQVVALATNGVVLSNGEKAAFVENLADCAIGNTLKLKGKKTTINGVPGITGAEEVEVTDYSDEVTYPATNDITATIQAYEPTQMDYVTVVGEVVSAAGGGYNVIVNVNDVEYAAYICNSTVPTTGLSGHIVALTGYSFGANGATSFNVIPTAIQDKGVSQLIYFEDDFEWIAPYAAASGADDSVGKDDAAATSPNVYSSLPDFVTDFNARGYDYYWGTQGSTAWRASSDSNPKVLYINKNYLKFGKTSYNAGITLPALKTINGKDNITIEFDYCFQITGKAVLDEMDLVVETNVGTFPASGGNVSEALSTEQPVNDSHLFWTHASVVLNGATAETVLKIHPSCVDPYASKTTTKCNRWFLDNIKIVPADGGGSSTDKTTVEFPIEWTIGVEGYNYAKSWPLGNGSATTKGTNGTILSTTGNGMIYYNNEAGNAADQASGLKKTKLDINANCPRVYGAWPGDYCEFSAEGTIAKGAQVQISFETRTSATNPKYWMLQYLDGSEWKPLGKVETADVEGTKVQYTHAMNADGATNIQVKETAVYANTTNGCCFRFVCKSAMGAGGTMLTAPNGGTWRLAVTDPTSSLWQPRLELK